MPRFNVGLSTLLVSLFSLVVQAQPTINSAQPSASVAPGGTATFTITIVGSSSAVTLSTSGLPPDMTPQFNPSTMPSPGNGTSKLTIATTATDSVKNYPFNVLGGGGTLAISLAVQQASGTSATSSDTLKNDFGFGVALGLSTNVTGPSIVNNATVDANGIVRVNTRANTSAGFMLESHYYIYPRPQKIDPVTLLQPEDTRWYGIGPFVAAQPGSSQIISAVGAGLMIGFRRPKGTTPSGFGLGFGYEAIPAAQVLGSEFVDGQKDLWGRVEFPFQSVMRRKIKDQC